ncbi:hypothetical protein APICC_07888 [Apis cerana cerana]|uniref:THD domain-containing protein n=1 Tax=Apis cerana cerana TaxID=94128 RepID=A0A2A3ELB0_APICC|nr:hypothetical protein APICC_07888 [Apis cerana cerana]
MDHIQGDIDLQIDNPSKNAANLIEWNVDMKVTVSKVQSLNINLLLLTSKYDRLNRSLNQVWIQRSERFLENKKLNDVKSLLEGASSISKTEIFDGIRNNRNLYTYNTIIPYLNSLKNFKRQHMLYNKIYDMNNTTILKLFMKLENNKNNASDTNLRIERATLTTENQNLIKKISNRVKRNHDNINDGDELNVWKESRSGRSRREERRGPLVATFVGAIPEQHITDTVYIGPWIKSTKNNTQYNLNKFHLVEDKKSIEVTATGLYMISAQIFYFGEPTNYSYWILLNSEGKSTTQKLVKCSTASSTSATEVSCYTSVITPLQRGDRVHIQQQERDRLINMREGHSYIQLVLLSNTICKKRLW